MLEILEIKHPLIPSLGYETQAAPVCAVALRCTRLCAGPDNEKSMFVTILVLHFKAGGEPQASENNNE